MKTIIILVSVLALTGCARSPMARINALEQPNCSTVTYGKANGRLGMSTVCQRGNDISIVRNI
jgi:hypothetical protein